MSKRSKRGKKNAETQTGPLESMLEIARLQEQVTLLTIENDDLRKHITENRLLKPATPRSPDVANTPSTRASKQRTAELSNRAAKNGKVTGRGCQCNKGNCSSRICGCVKKGTQCGALCRCNDTLCQNQEERSTEGNKENEESNERTRVEPEKITNKPLANVTAHKSIFSPDGALHSTPTLEPSRPSSLYFASPKKLTFEPDEEEKEEEKKVKRKAVKNLIAGGVNRLDRLKRVMKRPSKNIADPDTQETSPAPVEDNATEVPQDAAVQISNTLDQEQMGGSPLTNDLHESGSSNDSDFNPMKPQHELTRTPAQNSDSSSGNTSGILPLTPVFTIKMEEPPIPPELSQPEVDWNEHQSQLVACKKCGRKFHSFRIAKHQACCKKL